MTADYQAAASAVESWDAEPTFPISAYIAKQVAAREPSRARSTTHSTLALDGSTGETLPARRGAASSSSQVSGDCHMGPMLSGPSEHQQSSASDRSAGQGQSVNRSRTKVFRCHEDTCRQTFSSSKDQVRHYESVHLDLRIACPRCGKRLKKRGDNFRRHLTKYCKETVASAVAAPKGSSSPDPTCRLSACAQSGEVDLGSGPRGEGLNHPS